MVNCVVCLNLYRTLSGMPAAESGKKNDEQLKKKPSYALKMRNRKPGLALPIKP